MILTYRSKLLLGFLTLAVGASALVFALSSKHAKRSVFEQVQSQVLSIALDAASHVDAEELEKIHTEEDSLSPSYQSVMREMRTVRDRNRRDDVHVAFIYTYRQVGTGPDRFAYIVDAEEMGSEDRSPVGEVLVWEGQDTADDIPLRLGPAHVDERFVTDSYGTWLSANAPVRDESGKIVAMVGVDIAADHVIAQQQQATRWSAVALGIAAAAAALLSILLSRIATRPLARISEAIKKIGDGHLNTRLPEVRSDEFGAVAKTVNDMAQSLQERDALKGALSRYVSQDAARRLIEEKALPVLSGEKREVTVLMGDIANLNCIAEKLPPEQLVELLNEYFEKMVDIVFHHHGTIDRLIGNRLIAVFGAPVADEKKESNAIHAAFAMRKEQAALNRKWSLTGNQQFRLGVGIHTGDAIVGNIGSRGNIEFTVVGSSVDIAGIIGSKNDEYQTGTLISESTVDAVGEEFGFTEVGDIHPFGLRDFIRLYSVRELPAT